MQAANRPAKPATICRPCSKERSIRRAAERYRAALAAGTVPMRTCKRCGQTVAAQTGTWPMARGSPRGAWCLSCHSARQEDVDERMAAKRRISAAARPRAASKAAALARRASILGPDADGALFLGAHVLNESAETVAQRFAAAIEDPDDPGHFDALKFAAARILPMKVVSQQAAHLVRSGKLGAPAGKSNAAPRVTLCVSLTSGPTRK